MSNIRGRPGGTAANLSRGVLPWYGYRGGLFRDPWYGVRSGHFEFGRAYSPARKCMSPRSLIWLPGRTFPRSLLWLSGRTYPKGLSLKKQEKKTHTIRMCLDHWHCITAQDQYINDVICIAIYIDTYHIYALCNEYIKLLMSNLRSGYVYL